MMLANKTSRYDVAAHAVREGGKYNSKVQVVAHELASNFLHLKQKDKDYIDVHGMGELLYLCFIWFLPWTACVHVLIGISSLCVVVDPDATFDTPTF